MCSLFLQNHLFSLTILASDKGSPSQSTSVLVYLNVKDINDNEPQFNHQSYAGQVLENTAVGMVVLTVQATDIDSGEPQRSLLICITHTTWSAQDFKGPLGPKFFKMKGWVLGAKKYFSFWQMTLGINTLLFICTVQSIGGQINEINRRIWHLEPFCFKINLILGLNFGMRKKQENTYTYTILEFSHLFKLKLY